MLVMIGVIALFALFVTLQALNHNREFDPISYSPQVVERVDADGSVSVPLIDGINGPAVYLGDTVPVRGQVENSADHPVSVRGAVLWVEQPPGLRVVVAENVAGVFDPGTKQLRFENQIPDAVSDRVEEIDGPSSWYISGVVDVLEPGGVSTAWQTAIFTLVPDGWTG